MNCPICLSVMSCQSEIHHNKYGDIMDLHCFDDEECRKKRKAQKDWYSPFVKVLAPPNQTWQCLEYGLPYHINNEVYVLHGLRNNFTEIRLLPEPERVRYPSFQIIYPSFQTLNSTPPKKTHLISSPYIDLDTGNEMHLHAQKIFLKLYNLIAFA